MVVKFDDQAVECSRSPSPAPTASEPAYSARRKKVPKRPKLGRAFTQKQLMRGVPIKSLDLGEDTEGNDIREAFVPRPLIDPRGSRVFESRLRASDIALQSRVERSSDEQRSIRPIRYMQRKRPLMRFVAWFMHWLAPRTGEFSVDSELYCKQLAQDPFHVLAQAPMSVLLLIYACGWAVLIFILAGLLVAIGDNVGPKDPVDHVSPLYSMWHSAVQCSWTSLTTVGYGDWAPHSQSSSAATATFVVLTTVFNTFAIGIVFAKLSSPSRVPQHFIAHSSRACLCSSFSDHRGRHFPMRFEVRIHHKSSYALVDTTVKLTMARFHAGQGTKGRVCIEFVDLPLGNRTAGGGATCFLQYPWSVVHWIDADSPLAEYVTAVDGRPVLEPGFRHDHVEIICTALVASAATGSGAESRKSYTAETIDVGHTFADAIAHLTNGKLQIDLGQLSKTTPEEPDDLTLPQCF